MSVIFKSTKSIEAIIKHSELFPVPFCLFIGPQRAGTSWLYRYLEYRGDVCLPLKVKELFFFDYNFDKGADYYRSHFNVLPQHKLALEVTTTSFSHPEAPKRIFDYFGKDTRFICPLRNPVMRSYSLYRHFKRYGMVQGNLKEAVEQMPAIVETSRYASCLSNWFDIFGRDNIYFSFQEDLARDQEGYVRHICEGLGLPYIPVPPELSGHYNSTATPPSFTVAKIAQKSANFLRDLNLYWIINFAKGLGIKKYVFGDANPDPDPVRIPKEDKNFLEEKLSGEIERLENFLGYKIECWK